MKHCLISIILLFGALVLGGCDSKEPELPETALASIVTYESTADGTTLFTYTDGEGRLIELTAAWGGSEALKLGARVLIYYRAEAYGESGSVELLSVVPLPGGEPKRAADADAVPKSEPLRSCEAWLSGNYLNIGSVITFAGDAAEVGLYVDASTAESETPSAYVVVRAKAENAPLSAERRLYASWDVASILSGDAARGLDIYFTDSSNTLKVINITR